MRLLASKSALSGSAAVPGSKSHTIRAVALAALAEGRSEILGPLVGADTASAVSAYRALGARIDDADPGRWLVDGVAGRPAAPAGAIDVGNSGTTLFVALGSAALGDRPVRFVGDEQTSRRTAGPLLAALAALGARSTSRAGTGCTPIEICGPLAGGRVEISCPTSQYLTSLLLAAPLARGDSEITVKLLNERPYVEMTLDWLAGQGVRLERRGLEHYRIPGGQAYRGFRKAVAADWSGATFLLAAAAVTGSEILLSGLDLRDPQGDKEVVRYLARMGCLWRETPEGLVLAGGALRGAELDLNATPDALPALAVVGCFAEGRTVLGNVPQARQKETDRIAVMARELSRLGGRVEELPDGLVVHGGGLRGGEASGHGDHRVVMALAVAGLASDRPVEVDTAEAVNVTFPNFVELLAGLGADVRRIESDAPGRNPSPSGQGR